MDAIDGIRQNLTAGRVAARSEAERTSAAATPDPAAAENGGGQQASRIADAGLRPGADVQERPREDGGSEGLADRAARELAETQPFFRPGLEFKVDDDSGRTVITVFHPETEEVIRQIPPEQALALAQQLREQQEEGSGSAVSLIQTRA